MSDNPQVVNYESISIEVNADELRRLGGEVQRVHKWHEARIETKTHIVELHGSQVYIGDDGEMVLYAFEVDRVTRVLRDRYGRMMSRIDVPLPAFISHKDTRYKIEVSRKPGTFTIVRLTRWSHFMVSLADWYKSHIKNKSVYAHKRS